MCLRWPVLQIPPDITGRPPFINRAHRKVANGWRLHDICGFGLPFQPVIEPAYHVVLDGPGGSFGKVQLAYLVAFISSAMQPWANREPLVLARVLAALVLPSDEARYGSLIHEIEPAPDGEAGHIHFVKMQ